MVVLVLRLCSADWSFVTLSCLCSFVLFCVSLSLVVIRPAVVMSG